MDENNNYSNNSQGSFTQPPGGYDLRPPYYQPEMTLKDWVITLLVIFFVPCIGFIMTFVWAFSGTNETRSNFCKALLITYAIGIVVGLVFSFIFGASLAAMFGSMYF